MCNVIELGTVDELLWEVLWLQNFATKKRTVTCKRFLEYIFLGKGEETSESIFIFISTSKKNETNHFHSTFPIIYMRDSNFEEGVKIEIPSETSQSVTKMDQGFFKVTTWHENI